MSECKYKMDVSYLLLLDLIRLCESNIYLWGLAVRWESTFLSFVGVDVNIPVTGYHALGYNEATIINRMVFLGVYCSITIYRNYKTGQPFWT